MTVSSAKSVNPDSVNPILDRVKNSQMNMEQSVRAQFKAETGVTLPAANMNRLIGLLNDIKTDKDALDSINAQIAQKNAELANINTHIHNVDRAIATDSYYISIVSHIVVGDYYNRRDANISKKAQLLSQRSGVETAKSALENRKIALINSISSKTPVVESEFDTTSLDLISTKLNVGKSTLTAYRGTHAMDKLSNYYDDIVNPIVEMEGKMRNVGMSYTVTTYDQATLDDTKAKFASEMSRFYSQVSKVASSVMGMSLSTQSLSSKGDATAIANQMINHMTSQFSGLTKDMLIKGITPEIQKQPFVFLKKLTENIEQYYKNVINPINKKVKEFASMPGGRQLTPQYTEAFKASVDVLIAKKKAENTEINALVKEISDKFEVRNLQYSTQDLQQLRLAKTIRAKMIHLESYKSWSFSNVKISQDTITALDAAINTQNAMNKIKNDPSSEIIPMIDSAMKSQSAVLEKILGQKREAMKVLQKELSLSRDYMNRLNAIMPTGKSTDTANMDDTVYNFMGKRSIKQSGGSGNITQMQFRANLEGIRGYVEKINQEIQALIQETNHFVQVQLQGPELLSTTLRDIYKQKADFI